MPENALQVRNITYQYQRRPVLHDVSLMLEAHNIGILVGYNGSGKSTLLRCIAGWLHTTNGTIEANGINQHKDDQAYRAQIRFVPDTPDFYNELTAWEHLQFACDLARIRNWPDQAERLLDTFNLADAADTYPFTFSRGMRYKLALSMALIVEPSVLLLDEPFGPLDPDAASQLWQMLREFANGGGAVLLSAHSLPDNSQPDIFFHLRDARVETLTSDTPQDLSQILNQLPIDESEADAP